MKNTTAAALQKFPQDTSNSGIALYQLVIGYLLFSYINGDGVRVVTYANVHGIIDAISATFGISTIIWIGMWLSIHLLDRNGANRATSSDYLVLGAAASFSSIPVSGFAWIGITCVAVYFLWVRRGQFSTNAFWVVLALSFSSRWSHIIFEFFMPQILRIDAFLVSLVSNSDGYGNVVQAADGTTQLVVLEGCSSFNNLSLAFLSWICARSYFGTSGVRQSIICIAASAAWIIAVNTIRISLIALYPQYYEQLHGPIGANVAGLLITVGVAFVSIKGAQAKWW